MGKHVNYCKYCNLQFSEENKELFLLEKHILKDGSYGLHYRKSRCLKCLIAINKKKIDANRFYLNYIKENRGCKDCRKHYPYYVMHFDHLYDKSFNIGSSKMKDRDILMREIKKCDIVCANCHAERTYRRRIVKNSNKI